MSRPQKIKSAVLNGSHTLKNFSTLMEERPTIAVLYPVFNELDFTIKREEVSTARRSLKKNKSPGLDNILNEFFIAGKDILTENCDPVRLSDKDLNHLLYVDDFIVISKSPEGLQNCLNHLDEYCQSWDLNVNIDKSKAMIFNSSGRVLQNRTFLYCKKELQLVQSFTYLGITFSSSASFKKAYQRLGDKACKEMYPLIDAYLSSI